MWARDLHVYFGTKVFRLANVYICYALKGQIYNKTLRTGGVKALEAQTRWTLAACRCTIVHFQTCWHYLTSAISGSVWFSGSSTTPQDYHEILQGGCTFTLLLRVSWLELAKNVSMIHGRIQIGGRGSAPPPAKSQKYGPDRLKNHKATKSSFNIGRWWPDFSGIHTSTKIKSQSWTPSEKTFRIRAWEGCTCSSLLRVSWQELVKHVIMILSHVSENVIQPMIYLSKWHVTVPSFSECLKENFSRTHVAMPFFDKCHE